MSGDVGLLSVRVVKVEETAASIRTLRLEPVAGGLLPPFSAGAHVLVEIPDGKGARKNPYSITSSPLDLSGYEISVLRCQEGRGGSKALHRAIKVGSTLNIWSPVNLFPLASRARKHVLIAGGIGITPIKAMCLQLAHDRQRFELHYAVRSRSRGAHFEQISAAFGGNARFYIADEGQRLVAGDVLKGQPLGTHLYVCGPQRLQDEVLETARVQGWPEAALHWEKFAAPPAGKKFQVHLAKSNVTVSVGPDQTMLEAIEAAGVTAPYLCRGGVCGQCATQVLACDGTLLHADHVLTDAERASGTVILPCVSRFQGKRLVIAT